MTKRRYDLQFLFRTAERYNDQTGLLIENLRYAGLVEIVSEEEQANHAVEYVLRISPPHGMNEDVWFQQNLARMASFGINAAKVPR